MPQYLAKMSISRGLALSRMACGFNRNLLANKGQNLKQQIRHSGGNTYYYRKCPEGSKESQRFADILGGFCWWWIFWHIFTEYHEFIEPVYPDPSTFTDEELGIPPV